MLSESVKQDLFLFVLKVLKVFPWFEMYSDVCTRFMQVLKYCMYVLQSEEIFLHDFMEILKCPLQYILKKILKKCFLGTAMVIYIRGSNLQLHTPVFLLQKCFKEVLRDVGIKAGIVSFFSLLIKACNQSLV